MLLFRRPKRPALRLLLSSTLAVPLASVALLSAPTPAMAGQTFTAANAQTALTAFTNTYDNTSNGLFYNSESNHGPLDLWTSAYIRQGLCTANANTGGSYRSLISSTYYGFENYFKKSFTWTETINGQQQTTTDPYWWGEGVHDANDDMLWNVNAAICAYQATGDSHMLTEAERNARYILETQVDNAPGYGGIGMWRTWSTRDYKDISTGGQMVYIAMELAQYFPSETIYNSALGTSSTFQQYANELYSWERQWIQPDGSLLNGTNGSQTGYYDNNDYMMNVGILDDGAAALYKATGNASYISDAVRVTDWGRNRFTIPYNGVQILWPQWTTSNGGAHYDQWVDSDDGQNTVAKGIMSRGIIDFMAATGQTQYQQWMQDNANTAWANRHLSDNLLYTNWQVPNTLTANGLSSGNYTGVDIMERLINEETNPALANAGFETDGAGTTTPNGWTNNDFGNTANDGASYTESKASPYNARSGSYMLTQYKSTAYQTYESQTVTGIPNGTYTVSAWVRSSGGQTASYLDAKDFGSGADLTADISHASGSTWTAVSIGGVTVTNRQATIGIYSSSPAGKWVNVDDVQLTPQSVTNSPYTARNFSFEDNGAPTATPANWSTYDFGSSANDGASFTESKAAPSNARTGSYMLTHYKSTPYQIYTYQTVTGLTNGTYNLTAWVRTAGGQTASYMDLKDYGSATDLTADLRGAASGTWTLVSILNVPVTNGQATIGFYSNSGAGQWVNIDDVNLARH